MYLGAINYEIVLDSDGKFSSFTVGNNIPQYRNCLNYNEFQSALKYLLVSSPEIFTELFLILEENDSEIFRYVSATINTIGTYCMSLSSLESDE